MGWAVEMGDKSAIEWTDATWNPVTGCTKVSPGCKHCYAERLAARLQLMGNPRYRNGFDVTLHPDQLTLPLRWRDPKRIFVNSMSDLFHEAVPEEFIRQVFETMARAHWHTFQILTKRAERLAELAPRLLWPSHVWQGVSVENSQHTWRIASLRKVPAAVRFLSIEPLLGPIEDLPLNDIGWVIVGGESGPHYRPIKRAWVRGIRDQCMAAGIPFFFKQWGGQTPKSRGRLLDGRMWNEMPSRSSAVTSALPSLTKGASSKRELMPTQLSKGQLLGDGIQSLGSLRKRKSWDEAFFIRRRLTSRLKHQILTNYVKEFAYYLGSQYETLYYIDGFAGAGIYEDSMTEPGYGSPILIAEFAKRLLDTDEPFVLKCLNVEANRRRFRRLQQATVAFSDHIVEKNYHAPFIRVLDEILRKIGNAPAFFFLDPFGTKGIPFADLLPLLNRTAITEVFITLHTDGIAKKAGWFRALDDTNIRKRQTALALTEHLARALSISHDELYAWWKKYVLGNNGGTIAFEQRVLRHYQTLLKSSQTTFQFTKAFPVYYYRPDAPPDAEAPVCFYLIFGTQHQEGLYVMNDCMVKSRNQFVAQEYSLTFFPQFGEDIDKPKELARLQQEILSRFHDTPFTIEQMKQQLMQESCLLVKRGDYRSAVLALKRSGRLQQMDSGRLTNESTRFRVIENPPRQASEQQLLPLS
jgi:three-Cys-motif partner protein